MAKLAGVPAKLLVNAEDKLERLEEEGSLGSVTSAFQNSSGHRKDEQVAEQQLSLFAEPDPVIEQLKQLNLMEVTPSQAIKILEDLKELIND